jgi:hypothetical protein
MVEEQTPGNSAEGGPPAPLAESTAPAPAPSDTPAAVAAPTPEPAKPASTKGRWRPIVIVGAIVVFLAVVLFAVRNNVQANDLVVGDCFTLPESSEVSTVEKQPCTESHDAEVVFVGDYPTGPYPLSFGLESFVGDNCVPASEAYVGRSLDDEPALSIGYLSPTLDGWNNGDQSVTCYLLMADESKSTQSLKQP